MQVIIDHKTNEFQPVQYENYLKIKAKQIQPQ